MPNTVTPKDLPMTKWVIEYSGTSPARSEAVHAAYYNHAPGDTFVEFKDSNHKVVCAVRLDAVLSIRRDDTAH